MGADPIDYGRHLAQAYDNPEAHCSNTPVETVVRVLKELSRGGPALELGVGTGRVALPLAAAGVPVTGIDSSAELLEVLRGKPGGAELPVLLGNFRDLQGGPYDLIFALRDTFCHLLDQDDQLACFANVGQALAEGGTFVVETSMWPCHAASEASVERVADDRVVVRLCDHDGTRQLVSTVSLIFGDDGVRVFPSRIRHTHPGELDLMARLAGLTPAGRWADWAGSPLTSADGCAVSLYRLETRNW